MNSNKFFLGGIVGGVVYFVLGYLFYGLLLKKFFDQNGMATNMDTIIWWALIVGNLFFGLLLSYVIGKAKSSSAGSGAGVGFVTGLLVAISFDLISYSVHGGSTIKAIAADVAVSAVMSAIAGAFVGWIYGMSNKAAA